MKKTLILSGWAVTANLTKSQLPLFGTFSFAVRIYGSFLIAAYARQLHAYGDIFPFDGFDYPDVVECAPHKFAISARNRYMALNADFIIAYVCCDYGGAYEAVRAARNHGKPVIEIKMPAN